MTPSFTGIPLTPADLALVRSSLRLMSQMEPPMHTATRPTPAALRAAASRHDDTAVPAPPDMNERIRAAAALRTAASTPRHARAKAPTPAERDLAVRRNMTAPPPPEDQPLAIRAAARREYTITHAVPAAPSNEQQNRRLMERGR